MHGDLPLIFSRPQYEVGAFEIHAADAIVVGVDADDLFQLIKALADALQFFLHGGQGGLEFFEGDAHGWVRSVR